jgi:hypothetical protein
MTATEKYGTQTLSAKPITGQISYKNKIRKNIA